MGMGFKDGHELWCRVNYGKGCNCQSSASPTCSTAPHILELATNIRRNIRHMMSEMTIGDDRDRALIDYLNHMDTLAQQIEESR